MNTRSSTTILWLLLTLMAGPILAGRAEALTYTHTSANNSETLVLTFEGFRPETGLERTGATELRLKVEDWERQTRPKNRRFESKLLYAVNPTDDGIVIDLKSRAFGYIKVPGPSDKQIEIVIFPDPIGARWQPKPRVASQPIRSAEAGSAPAERNDGADATPVQASEQIEERSGDQPAEDVPFLDSVTGVAKAGSSVRQNIAQAPKTEQAVASDVVDEPAEQTTSSPAPLAPETSDGRGAMAVSGPAEELAATGDVTRPGGLPFFTVPFALRAPAEYVGPELARTYSTTSALGNSGKTMNARDMEKGPNRQRPQSAEAVDEPLVEEEPLPAEQPEAVAEVPEPEATTAELSAEVAPETEEEAEPAPGPEMLAEQESDSAQSKGEKPPLTYDDLFGMAQRHMANGEFDMAIDILNDLKQMPDLPEAMREEVYFSLGESYYQLYRNDLRTHYADVAGALERAVNYNPDSPRVPAILLQLGLTNLKVGNLPEAKAYFSILRKRYDGDPNIPYIDFYWGEHYFGKGDYQKAADAYQVVVQKYPDSSIIREAALGMARSLEKLEFFEQAYKIVDFIDKRWPRFYLESPEFLRLSGELANKIEAYGEAKDDLWNYYNLEPDAPGSDVVLARIGDIYLRTGQKAAAKEIYQTVAKDYPEEEGGLVAKMRLAEEGIYDSPTVEQMFSVFDRPYNLRPKDIYTQIVKKYPKSALAPLAQLKLSMWMLWENKYWDSLQSVSDFFRIFPQSLLAEKARDVGMLAYQRAVDVLSEDKNSKRIVDTWYRYPFLAKHIEAMAPRTVLLTATSLWQEGQPAKALALVEPFLQGPMDGTHSEMAMNLAVSIYVDQRAWDRIAALADQIEKWNLKKDQRRQLEYSLALALENLGRRDKSRPLWAKLAADPDLDKNQRAYAMFYMARSAEEDGDLRKEYLYAQEALAMFMQSEGDREKIKDCLLMLIDVTRRAKKLEQALYWAMMYERYIDETDPDWAASRFRLAEIQKGRGNSKAWKEILSELIEKNPRSLYGRMAASALEAVQIKRQAEPYTIQ